MSRVIQSLMLRFLVLLLYFVLANISTICASYVCPTACRCNYNVTVSCDAGLQMIPKNISELTKSLHLGGNVTTHNKFTRVRTADLPNMADLRHFTCSFSEIETLDDKVFENYKELRQLKLNHNIIKVIGSKTFTGLSKLEVLDLSGNPNIKINPGTFQNLPTLRELYLGEVGLQELDFDVFSALPALTVLDIHGNAIKRLDIREISLFPALNILDISSNSLTTLDGQVWGLISQLQLYHISGNPWNCNCLMKNLKHVSLFNTITNDIICMTPEAIAYAPLSRVSDSDLKCIPPRINSCDNTPLSVIEGNALILSCNVTGDPFPSIEWITPMGVIYVPDNSTLGSARVTENGTLDVYSISVLDSGIWTLKIFNIEGIVERDFTINVQATTTSSTTARQTTTMTTSSTTARQNMTMTTTDKYTTATAAQGTTSSRNPTSHHPGRNTTSAKLFVLTLKTNNTLLHTTSNVGINSQTTSSEMGVVKEDEAKMGRAYVVGIIMASVGGGCSVVFITTLCILLFKFISGRNKVGVARRDDRKISNRRIHLAFV